MRIATTILPATLSAVTPAVLGAHAGAQFSPAYEIVLRHEGGWVNDPDDAGGETYRGIARNFYPDWFGWDIIDFMRSQGLVLERGDFIDDATLEDFVEMHYRNLWDGLNLGAIQSQKVANIFFDFIILAKNAISTMQQVLNSLGHNLVVDNILGPRTIEAINATDPAILHDAYKSARFDYHIARVEAGVVSAKFLDGWIRRTSSFASLTFPGNGTIATVVVVAAAAGLAIWQHNREKIKKAA